MQEYVVDASVLMKFVLVANESDLEQTKELKKNALSRFDIRLLVPPLWKYEVGNTILSKVPGRKEQEEALSLFLNFPFYSYDFSELDHLEILRIARDCTCTYYDTSYYYLAKVRSCLLVTADEKFIKKVGDKRIVHIQDYPFHSTHKSKLFR